MMGLSFADACYSIDTSSMIELAHYYPREVFPSPWEKLGVLADQGRLLICEQAYDECEDPQQRAFFGEHTDMVVGFDSIQDHFAQFQREVPLHGIELTNPQAIRETADPYIISLALATEHRGIGNLRERTQQEIGCVVVTQERRKMPRVCDFYALEYTNLMGLFRKESMSF